MILCRIIPTASLLAALLGGPTACTQTTDVIGSGLSGGGDPAPRDASSPNEPDAQPPAPRASDAASAEQPPPDAAPPDSGVAPELGPFSPPVALATFTGSDDPTSTADGLELYFDTGGTGRIKFATRTSRADPWGSASDFLAIGPDAQGTTPWITPDGLRLFFASVAMLESERDIWWMQRASRTAPWMPPEQLQAVNSADGDFAPGLSHSGLELVLTRIGGDLANEELFFSKRDSTNSDWNPPELAPLSSAEGRDSDAVFGPQDLTLWWVRETPGRGLDLFVASRATTGEPFASPRPVTELNSDRDDGDPWISPDGREIMFYSTRSGPSRLYRATR